MTVKEERSGWRDEMLSQRHRDWGFNCPAIDIDFLLIEYNSAKVKALVEYKHERAFIPHVSSQSFRAIADLGDRADIPVFLCVYSDDLETFKVSALNGKAKSWCAQDGAVFTEQQWVRLLYDVRGFGDMSLDAKLYFQRKRKAKVNG